MTVYTDSDYKCYTAPAAGRTAVETDFFDGKCTEYIVGYRYIPAGETWTREDGVAFEGEMITPWKTYTELDAAQREFERERYLASLAAVDELLLLI